MMPQRFNPATMIALICGIASIFLLDYLKFVSYMALLICLAIFITLSVFLMWKYPRLRYWYETPK